MLPFGITSDNALWCLTVLAMFAAVFGVVGYWGEGR